MVDMNKSIPSHPGCTFLSHEHLLAACLQMAFGMLQQHERMQMHVTGSQSNTDPETRQRTWSAGGT